MSKQVIKKPRSQTFGDSFNKGSRPRTEQSGFRPDQEANYLGTNYGWQKFIGGLERVIATQPV